MKKIIFLLFAFTLLSISFMYAQPAPPILLYPADEAIDLPVQDLILQFDQPGWIPDSFFDIYVDIDSLFPNPVHYTGPLAPARTFFEYHIAALLTEQTYYWFVRYSDFVDTWISEVRQFTTGNYVVPSSTISGTTSSSHNVSAVKVTCPQACVPNSINTGIAGTYSFTVNNGLNPVVTPTKQGYWFNPGFSSYTNIQTNQTANFTMNSLLPNTAIQPIPVNLAEDVSVDWSMLQWTYVPGDFHSAPTDFHGTYFIILNDREEVVLYEETVPYSGAGDYAITLPPSVLPMDYNTTYYWEVVPFNADGEAEGIEIWEFTTEDPPVPPPVPLYTYPTNHQTGVRNQGLIIQWGPPANEEFPEDAVLTVANTCDAGIGPWSIIYSGPDPAPPDPMNPSGRCTFVPDLSLNTQYYWKVVVFDPATGLTTEGPVWDFITTDISLPPLPPILLSPSDMATNVNPEVEFGLWKLPEMELAPAHTTDIAIDDLPPLPPGLQELTFPGTPLDSLEGIYYCQLAALQPLHTYYWNARYINFDDHYYSISETWEFTTGDSIPAAPPILLLPLDEAVDLPTEEVVLKFDQPNWQVDSFFDIYFSPEPLNPLEPDSTALVYHGPLTPSRTFFEYHIAALMSEQTYYWFVRYSDFVDSWTSEVRQFTTGNYVVPSSTISGKTLNYSGGFASGITVTCSVNGIVVGKTYSSGIDGSYSFNLANSTTVTYYIASVPPSAIQYFTPSNNPYANLSQDHTGEDFYLGTYTPYQAFNPVPAMNAQNVSINIGQLQWSYVQPANGYGEPTGFEVYFPADNPVPVIVPYIADRDSLYDYPIGPLMPDTEYYWKVIPFNQYGPYELQDTWWYVTEIINNPSQPNLIDPPMFADDFETGNTDSWSFVMPRNRPVEDYIFDVYMDTDSTFTAPPNYTGDGHPDPANPGYYWSIATNLAYGAHYYWKVKVTDTSNGLSNESVVWQFDTRDEPSPPTLILPPDNATDILVQDVELSFNVVNYNIDSFFDVFCDIDSLFPNPPLYSGPLNQQRPVWFTYDLPPLQPNQVYYWRVKYHNLAEEYITESDIYKFTTGNYVVPSSTISGTISSVHNVSSVTVTCPQACVPNSVNTGIAGTYSFTVNNGLNPVVTPTKQGYWFNPGFTSYTNIQTNQTANFYMTSNYPAQPIWPVPAMNAQDVSINIGQLQWSYVSQPGYTDPTGFEVYFPADNPVPVIVPYISDRDSIYTIAIDNLDYNAIYQWVVVTYNDYGPVYESPVWMFETEAEPVPPPEYELVEPPLFTDGFETGGRAAWAHVMPRNRPVEDYIFDVYMDTDSTFSAPPMYTGDGNPDAGNPGYYWCVTTNLAYGAHYYWKVKCTDTSNGLSSESVVWQFDTRDEPSPPTLILPPDNATDILVQDVELSFNVVNYNIDSFFDIFCDIDSLFPNPVLYSGTLTQQRPVWFTYNLPPLQPNQVYYWRVKYHNLAEEYVTESDIYRFTTGNYVVPSSTISGTISSVHNVSSVKVTCPQACVPNSVNTGIAGTYSFTVNNGLNPVVTPTKQGYWFNPGFASYNNIQVNQTANFYMTSSLPFHVILPVPAMNAQDVSINIGQLQWTYLPEPGYSDPTGFEVYFPADNPTPVIVPYIPDRDSIFTFGIGPLDYSTNYDWIIIPFNNEGWAEYMETWSFETEPYPEFPPTPLYVYPSDHQTDVKDAGLVMYWEPSPDREEFPPESFFDVFCDIDSLFPSPPIYSGPARVDSLNPANRLCYVPFLSLETTYYWKVRVTDTSNGLSSESDIWDFTTQDEHIPLPTPVLVSPPHLLVDFPPFGEYLKWDWDWAVDSFFDITYDIDPLFSNSTIISGYWNIARTILECHIANLMTEQTYYWYVRYTNFADHWYSQSPVWSFTTGNYIPSEVIISYDGTISWAEVPGAENYNIYRADGPDGPFSLVGTTLSLWWLDPAFPGIAAFYYVTSVIPEPARK